MNSFLPVRCRRFIGWCFAVIAATGIFRLTSRPLTADDVVRKHEAAVQAIAVSPDRTLVATAGADGNCYIIDTATRTILHKTETLAAELTGVAFNGDRKIIVGSHVVPRDKSSIRSYTPGIAAATTVYAKTSESAEKLSISTGKAKIAWLLNNNAIKVHTLDSGKRFGVPPPPGGDVCHGLALSPEGKFLAVCNHRGVYIFQLEGGKEGLVEKYDAPKSGTTAVAYSSDGKELFIGFGDGRVSRSEVGKTTRSVVHTGGASAITSIDVAASADHFVAASENGEIHLWDRKRETSIQVFKGHSGAANDVAFVSDALVVSAGEDNTVRFWKTSLSKTSAESVPGESLKTAAILRNAGKLSEAMAMLKSLGSKSVKASGASSPQTLVIMRRLAECQRAAGDHASAIGLLKTCFRASEPHITRTEAAPPDDAIQLALTIAASGDNQTAIAGLINIGQSREQKLGAESAGVADIKIGLGRIYMTRSEWADAIEHFEQGIEIRRKLKTREDLLIEPLWRLGECRLFADQADQAEIATKEAVALAEKHAPDTWQLVAAKAKLGMVYASTGRADEGSPLLFANVVGYRSENGLDGSADCASALADLAHAFNVVGRFDNGITIGKEAVQATELAHGLNSSECISPLAQLGFANMKSRKNAEAEVSYLRCRDISARCFGVDAWQGGQYESSLATLRFVTGDNAAAERLFLRAIELHEANPAGLPQSAGATYHNLANLYVQQAKWAKAADCQTRAAKRKRATLYATLPLLPDGAKARFAVTVMAALRQPFSDAVTHRDQQELVDASAEWLLNLKGFASEVLAQRSDALQDRSDPAVRNLLNELSSTRMKLASGSMAVLQPKNKARRAALRQKENEIVVQLGAETSDRYHSDAWTTLDDIRSKLPEDTVVIEFLQMHYKAGDPRIPHQNIYVAWIIPPADKGDVKLVLLGNQAKFDRMILAYQRGMEASFAAILQLDEATVESQLNQVARTLSVGLVDNLPGIEEYGRWLISPDASLWFVPWPALVTKGGRYVIERHQIEYLVTSRQLTWKQQTGVPSNAPVIFANPDYDAGLKPGDGAGIFAPLPGTAKEAKAVAPFLKAYTHNEPVVLLKEKASEATIKRINSPSVLHLSTHGYFDALSTWRGRNNAMPVNPLLRCGLAFAGANGALSSTNPLGNDGVLTGLEVTSLNLRGTDLVVLSACQTGLGDLNNGEGVAGLRQAFQLAGAKSVVATLWSIPDGETADLMTAFVEQLSKSNSAAAALQKAQQAIIAKRRKAGNAAHPYFWSAFGVTRTGD